MADTRIYIIGLPGVGKSYSGRQLATVLNVPFADLDALIEQQAGKAIAALFAEGGEEAFRKLEADVLRTYTEANNSFVMACGGGTPCFFDNINYMNSRGLTVYLREDLQVITQRLEAEQDKRPMFSAIAIEKIPQKLGQITIEREPFYLQARLITDAEQLATKIKLFF